MTRSGTSDAAASPAIGSASRDPQLGRATETKAVARKSRLRNACSGASTALLPECGRPQCRSPSARPPGRVLPKRSTAWHSPAGMTWKSTHQKRFARQGRPRGRAARSMATHRLGEQDWFVSRKRSWGQTLSESRLEASVGMMAGACEFPPGQPRRSASAQLQSLNLLRHGNRF